MGGNCNVTKKWSKSRLSCVRVGMALVLCYVVFVNVDPLLG